MTAASTKDRALALADLMDQGHQGSVPFLFYGARSLAGYHGADRIEAATALLTHLADEKYALRNGLRTTSSIHEIRRVILRMAS